MVPSGVTACFKLLPKLCHLLFCRYDEKGNFTLHVSKLTIAYAFNGYSLKNLSYNLAVLIVPCDAQSVKMSSEFTKNKR